MGNTLFGGIPTNAYKLYFYPDITPHPLDEPVNNPSMGFANRVERETAVGPEEYYSAKLPLKDRDYCVDHLLEFMACRRDYWPFPVFCEHEKHVYLNCVYDDYVLRMKEYERERRLLARGIITKQVKTDQQETQTEDEDK